VFGLIHSFSLGFHYVHCFLCEHPPRYTPQARPPKPPTSTTVYAPSLAICHFSASVLLLALLLRPSRKSARPLTDHTSSLLSPRTHRYGPHPRHHNGQTTTRHCQTTPQTNTIPRSTARTHDCCNPERKTPGTPRPHDTKA